MTCVEENIIKGSEARTCFLCGSGGILVYRGLKDKLFGVPGTWDLRKCQNSECGLAWLDPMPSKEDIYKAYQEYYTHEDGEPPKPERHSRPQKIFNFVKNGYLSRRYGYLTSTSQLQELAGLGLYFFPYRRARVDRSVSLLKATPGGRLLDVGCGNGQKLSLLRSLGWTVTGTDVDPKAVRQAQAKGLEVHLGSLEVQQFPDDFFDVITLNHVIEHVNEPHILLEECRRILKPSGLLLVFTPNSESLGHRLYKHNWLGLDVPRHLYLYNRLSLLRLLTCAGFGVRSLKVPTYLAYFISLASRSLASQNGYKLGSPAALPDRFLGFSFLFFEWMLNKINRESGEEFVVWAGK
jgi:2-polyprenyl-3-methyl-5-hydroxy-6-metoxy-1,4-benzoquinol methylase